MQIRLQTLEHQQRALKSLTHVFRGVSMHDDGLMEANPILDLTDPHIRENIFELQSGILFGNTAIPYPNRTRVDDGILGIDMKMETGTGKTLVYTQMMYELYRLYGFSKFIILVPSTAIKAGTEAFIKSEYARSYLEDRYDGKIHLDLEVLEPQKSSKGKKFFPIAVSNFVSASRLTKGRVQALLMTDGMLRSDATLGFGYDQVVLGMSSRPYDALAATRPVVIIDEPHRFKRNNKAYKTLVDQLKPQAIIRFGATFPQDEKTGKLDYNNLIYNLGAVEAFNSQLVKGVVVQYPKDDAGASMRLKLTNFSTKSPKQATFTDLDSSKIYKLGIGETLAEADSAFAGISVESVGKVENAAVKTGVALSNGKILAKGDTLIAGVYTQTYQEVMLSRALDNHFETEWDNFRRTVPVKTLSLFFIDSVESYRGLEGAGYLRLKFEELLSEKLRSVIAKFEKQTSPIAREYLAYLRASLADLSATNGGYFSADNSTSDKAIQDEVRLILKDKQTMLTFKNSDGSFNTMRFIFSKWTLREGWDNPNVFQIVKLRSSGSEISKLQEVGRGLRLPVDTNGTRLADEDFRLTYLVDYTEENFAKTLVSEINADAAVDAPSIRELLPRVAVELDMDENWLFIELLQKGLVDTDKNLIEGKESEFYELYPQFAVGKLKAGKIVEDKAKVKVGIRKNRYSELRHLWEAVNAKYYLRLDELTEDEISECIDDILAQDVYRAQTGTYAQEAVVAGTDGELSVVKSIKDVYAVDGSMPYGKWLRIVFSQTSLPLKEVHAGLVRLNSVKKLPTDFFNSDTLAEFITQFHLWMQREFLKRFSYTRIEGALGATALTDADGSPLDSIAQGNVGLYRENGVLVPENFLYDAFVFDSPKEKETIRESILDEVVVYGKIPRRSIRIPVYFGGTTSPDFMYVLKTSDGRTSINFVIETKDVESRADLREVEQLRIRAARAFFEAISSESLNVQFAPQLKRDHIVKMIQQVLAPGE
ncbi:MAG: type III restriction-modification system endonuclease [Bifidobacteriaceae bacterium]|nr:type III restriction-modification system endonuclease [Bifidobacteriaceae bacterium]